jgi:hypothetical protein
MLLIARRLTLACLCVLAGVSAVGAGPATALVSQFGGLGEEAGQFLEAKGVAVNQASGNVYLVDRNNYRVDEFSGEGVFVRAWGWGVADGQTKALQTCTGTCSAGLEGAGAGQFNGSEGVAVDNDPLSLSYEHVFVADRGNNRVEEFTPNGEFVLMLGGEVNENGSNVCHAGEKCRGAKEGSGHGEFSSMSGTIATGANGNVYVGDYERVQELTPEGAYVSSVALAGGRYTFDLAVDAAGEMYVVSEGFSGVRKYSPAGTLLQTLDEGALPALTLDSAGDLFASEPGPYSFGSSVHHIREFGPAGEELVSFDAGMQGATGGIVFGETVKELYVLGQEAVRLVAVPPRGVLLVGEVSASAIEPTSEGLHATVNPEGHATTYRFEYGPTSSYGSSVPAPEGSLAAGFKDEPVSVTLTKLTAGATYHYRVVATDSQGHVATGADEAFTTLPAVRIDSEYTTEVASTSVTFGAQLDPLGVEATYHIEYDTSEYTQGGAAHGTSLAEGSLGSGGSDVAVSAHVDGLLPHTVYHYRVVAHDVREGVPYVVQGPDEVLTTQGTGSMVTLPDGRAWELVSPVDKHGARIFSFSRQSLLAQASAAGGAVTYVANVPTEPAPKGYLVNTQVLSRHGVGGWSSKDLSTPNEEPVGEETGGFGEYALFSEDLSAGYVNPTGAHPPLLSPWASERTPYVHRQSLCESEATASECYVPLLTEKEGYADVPPGTHFAVETNHRQGGTIVEGATPDLSHIVIQETHNVSLTTTPAVGSALYEWSAGKPPAERLQLVSILPASEGAQASPGILGGYSIHGSIARGAITREGTRVVWTITQRDAKYLYVRDLAKGETLRIDVKQPGVKSPVVGAFYAATFQFTTDDGSNVFFTDGERLTNDSGARENEPDLYECEIVEEAGRLACKLRDLTPLSASGERAALRDLVLGGAEDGSYVYFMANGVLAQGAKPGNCTEKGRIPSSAVCNLYVLHDGTVKFVAALSEEDEKDWAGTQNSRAYLQQSTARMSPNGRFFSFMSKRSLTGYDNRDARSGMPDEEVYVYDAQSGHLACASCNPTGAHPMGLEVNSEEIHRLVTTSFNEGLWFAGYIPDWTTNHYQSRYVSDTGRVFFDSSDALVPQDINGVIDVYEFEPAGVGDCTSGSATYSPVSGGCVGLVSSGSSPDESAFLDASLTGNDVFFLTTEKLVSQDVDTSLDVYDAHVCSTGWSCASQPVPVPACTTADSCRSAPSPQPSVFGSPASATFSGAGNITQSTPGPAVRGRSLTRAQKLASALRACHSKKSKRRRLACERRAERRYAAKLAGKAGVKRSRG